MTVYIVFLTYVMERVDAVQEVYRNEEDAKAACKLPEGAKPSGLCYLHYKPYKVIETEDILKEGLLSAT